MTLSEAEPAVGRAYLAEVEGLLLLEMRPRPLLPVAGGSGRAP